MKNLTTVLVRNNWEKRPHLANLVKRIKTTLGKLQALVKQNQHHPTLLNTTLLYECLMGIKLGSTLFIIINIIQQAGWLNGVEWKYWLGLTWA